MAPSDDVAASPLGAPASSPGNDAPASSPGLDAPALDASALRPSRLDAPARVSVHSQNSDYLAMLARSQMSLLAGSQMSQMSNASSISSDFRGMLLNDMSDSTLDSLLSESMLRARQRQEDFRHSLDSCHMNLNGSMARAWQRSQEDSKLAASAAVIGSETHTRSRRRSGENIAIKKRTKLMKEVNFDPVPDDKPQYQRKVSRSPGRTKLMEEVTSDCLALLAGSQRSRGSSISSDFGGMLLDGSSESTLGDSCLLNESIIRARQRQEKFRNSLDSYHLDASLNRSRRQQQEDFRLAASAVSRDHNSSFLRKDSAQSIGSESTSSLSSSIRSRRDRRRVPLKKRSKLMMREVNFDPPPEDRPRPNTEWTKEVDIESVPDDKPGEDAAVVQSLLTLGRGGTAACGTVASPDINEQPESMREVNFDPCERDGPSPAHGNTSNIGHHSFCDAEARQLQRLAASIERTGRSRRRLMSQRGAANRSAAFFAGTRDTLTDGLEESRRQLRLYADTGEGAMNDGAA